MSDLIAVDSALAAVCSRAMAPVIRDRYSSASDLAAALELVTRDREAEAKSRVGTWSWPAAIAVGALLLGLALLYGRFARDAQKRNLEMQAVLPSAAKADAVASQPPARTAKSNWPSSLRIATKRSAGRFVDSGQRLGDSRSVGVSLADFDGDQDLDALVVDRGGKHRVWLNDGDGGFQQTGQVLGNIPGISCVVGDVDGDGDLDAVICGDGSNENRVWLNDAQGHFSVSETRIGTTANVAFGDVDADGDLDLCGLGPELWENDGHGQFAQVDLGLPKLDDGINQQVKLVDADADGDLDLFLSMYRSRFGSRLWKNDGRGHFRDSEQSLGVNASFTDVELGDLDGDGDVDAFLPTYKDRDTTMHLWINGSDGIFQCSHFPFEPAGMRSHTATLGNVDGDNDLDIVVDFTDVPSVVYLNNGRGEFVVSGHPLGDHIGQFTALGDLDGDGDLDAFLANDESDDLADQIWLNVGDAKGSLADAAVESSP